MGKQSNSGSGQAQKKKTAKTSHPLKYRMYEARKDKDVLAKRKYIATRRMEALRQVRNMMKKDNNPDIGYMSNDIIAQLAALPGDKPVWAKVNDVLKQNNEILVKIEEDIDASEEDIKKYNEMWGELKSLGMLLCIAMDYVQPKRRSHKRRHFIAPAPRGNVSMLSKAHWAEIIAAIVSGQWKDVPGILRRNKDFMREAHEVRHAWQVYLREKYGPSCIGLRPTFVESRVPISWGSVYRMRIPLVIDKAAKARNKEEYIFLSCTADDEIASRTERGKRTTALWSEALKWAKPNKGGFLLWRVNPRRRCARTTLPFDSTIQLRMSTRSVLDWRMGGIEKSEVTELKPLCVDIGARLITKKRVWKPVFKAQGAAQSWMIQHMRETAVKVDFGAKDPDFDKFAVLEGEYPLHLFGDLDPLGLWRKPEVGPKLPKPTTQLRSSFKAWDEDAQAMIKKDSGRRSRSDRRRFAAQASRRAAVKEVHD